MDKKKLTKKEELDLKFEENIIDWCTFYRRNIHRFIEHYFGIKLHLYQIIMIYLMNLCPIVVVVSARAISKSFITSLYACAVCVLYPNSKVVVTAKLKQTARLLVSEKIEKELMNMSPNLRREIKKIQSNQNHVEVVFHNGSSLLCCACNDNSRGLRATTIITDEFRQVDKDILDSVFSPMKILRPTPYTMKKEFKHLGEEPREVYLSSAYWKNHWMYKTMKDAVVSMYKDKRQLLFGTDYALSVKF